MRSKTVDFLIYATILLLPLYLVRFSILGMPTNLVEMAILAIFLLWIIDLKKTSPIFSLPKIFWISTGLLFLGLATSAFFRGISFQELGIIKGWFVIPFLFFLAVLDKTTSQDKAERAMRFFFVSAVGMGGLGLYYLWNGRLTFDGRLQIFYLSPNHLAMFLVPAIIFGAFSLLKMMSETTKHSPSFYFLLSGSLILLINLYATLSYAAWLALFLSLVITFGLTDFLDHARKIKIFFLLLTLAIFFSALQVSSPKMEGLLGSDPRSSLASRMMIWQSAWKIGMDNFFWGIGPGNFQSAYLEYQKYFPPYLEWAVPQPHNIFLAFWLQSGILGLSGFLLLVGSWMIKIFRSLQNKKGSFLEASFFAIALYVLIHGMLDTPYWKNDLAIFFWLTIALGVASLRKIDPIQMSVGAVDEK